jgi:FKBP-type peptidyl-prolyl cis-trans isomerase FkpA
MNKFLLLCWCVLLFTACSKVDDPAVINPEQSAIDDKLIADYIAANNITNAKRVENILGRPDTIGVYYVVEKQGPLNTLYSLSSSVTVGYTGRLLGSPTPFIVIDTVFPSYVLGQTIRGWQIGVPKVNKGGTIRLFIPSRYAYGPYAQPLLGLPANAVLDFTIQVFDVTN